MKNFPTDHLTYKGPNLSIGGDRLVYRIGNYGLSFINSEKAHGFDYAWECLMIRYKDEQDEVGDSCYDSRLTNGDVIVFSTEEEALDWLNNKAFPWMKERSSDD